MVNLTRKALPALFLLFALALGAWTVAPGAAGKYGSTQQAGTGTSNPVGTGTSEPVGTGTSFPMETASPMPTGTAPGLGGWLGALPGVQEKITEIESYHPNMRALVGGSHSILGRQFVKGALATNTEELKVLNFALERVTNADLRGLIQFMISQHSESQTILERVNKSVNRTTSVSLTNVKVFPSTGDWVLGIRTVNLDAKYYDRLASVTTTGDAFDLATIDILLQMHHADVESEIAALNQIHGISLHNFFLNGAKMTELHIKLLTALYDQVYIGIQPDVSFEKYQGSTGGGGTPTVEPTTTEQPTMTEQPTQESTLVPTQESTLVPTQESTQVPTQEPTLEPTLEPSGTAMP